MIRSVFTFLSVFVFSISLSAQRIKVEPRSSEKATDSKKERPSAEKNSKGSNEYHDLLMLFIDGDLDKCLKKSIKLTEDEATSKDPMPYVYASMCYLEFWNDEEARKDFPEALKEAFKMATRYRKKDERASEKKGLNELEFWEANKEFFGKLRQAAKLEAQAMLDQGKQAKAESWYKQIINFDPSDYSSHYAFSTLRLMAGDTAQGNEAYRQYKEGIEKVKNELAYEAPDKINLLKTAHIEFAKFLIRENRSDAAKETISELKAYIKDDNDVRLFEASQNW